MKYIISRALHDRFTFSLYEELLSQIDCDYQSYHIWSNPPEILKTLLTKLSPTSSNVIVGIKDLLDCWEEYHYWNDEKQIGVQLLIELAARYPNKNFVIFTSLENLSAEISNSNNIQLVNWGGDLTNQLSEYQLLDPVTDKNFSSTKHFINLNRQARLHRITLLSYLFGAGYNKFGNISFLKQNEHNLKQLDYLSRSPWEFDEHHDELREFILSGHEIMKTYDLVTDPFEIYQERTNDNVFNFNHSLRHRYQDSFVEIVSETTFSSPSFLLTEKTLNSIYGCNLPILISGAGAVAHLRDIGFDMFDDVIDHSYDLMDNPFDRMGAAIRNNHRLLTDADYAKQQWLDCQDRLLANVNVAKTKMPVWYAERARKQFNELKWI